MNAANLSATPPLINLLDYDRAGLEGVFATVDERPFRATQVLQWVHQYGVTDFNAMTNLSKALRAKLQAMACIALPEIAHEQRSADGTHKWLFRLVDGNCVETVFIPERKRGTLCVSSQVGCALNCSFCSTGHQGFSRNLSIAEIIGQVWMAVRALSTDKGLHDKKVTNVVMMGMGEPLLNFDAVVAAMNLMMDDFAYGLSKRRVTLSTSGVVPEMVRLATVSDVALAVSLHAPNDALRDQLVPINKKYPLSELMAVCKQYYQGERRRITFEYVMLSGVNDSLTEARALIRLLQGVPAKVNLIPFNPFPQTHYQRSAQDVILSFRDVLHNAGITTIIRKTRGEDIDGACGQLVGEFDDRTRRRERLTAKHLQSIPIAVDLDSQG